MYLVQYIREYAHDTRQRAEIRFELATKQGHLMAKAAAARDVVEKTRNIKSSTNDEVASVLIKL